MEEFFGFRNFRQFERTRREIKLPYDLLNDIRLPSASRRPQGPPDLPAAALGANEQSPAQQSGQAGAADRGDRTFRPECVRRLRRLRRGGKADLAGPLCEPARARQHARGSAGARRRTMSKMQAGDQAGNGSHRSSQQRGQDRRI